MILKMPQSLLTLAVAFIFSVSTLGQSADANFPTPLTTSMASGTINLRAVGDSRDTTYYFAFEGRQGDVFLNISTRNLTGTIDVFSSDTTRTFTTVPIFADANPSETGRVIYLRRRERLLLRVQGRAADEVPATFQIKFAGSFLAIANPKEDATTVPTLLTEAAGKVRVNPVGTILPPERVEQKAEPVKLPVPPNTVVAEKTDDPPLTIESEKAESSPPRRNRRRGKPKIVVTDTITREAAKLPAPARRSRTTPSVAPKTVEPDPLANVRLVIKLKNGETIERILPEVLRFSVKNGVLVVVGKDRMIRRYPMTEVERITVQ